MIPTDRVVTLLRLFAVVLMTAIAVAMFAVRVSRFDVPFERDEGEYAYIAQLLLEGVPLFREAFTMKLPGVPLLYAASFWAWGQTVSAAHTAGLLADLTTGVCLSAILWLLSAHKQRNGVAVAAAMSATAVLLTVPMLQGFFANCEKFVIAAVCLSALSVLMAERSKRPWAWLLLYALSSTLAVFCKQHAVLFVVAVAVALVRQRVWATGALLALTGVVSLLMLAIHCYANGTWDDFWFYAVKYASAYVDAAIRPWDHLAGRVRDAQQVPTFICVMLFMILVPVVWRSLRTEEMRDRRVVSAGDPSAGTDRRLLGLCAALTIAGVVATSVGFWFRPHYLVFLVPALALCSGLVLGRFSSLLVLWLPCLLATLILNRQILWEYDNNKVSAKVYGTHAFVQARDIGLVLKKSLKRSERVFVLGSEPEVFFYSHRKSITPYIYLYPLSERQPFRDQQRGEVLSAVNNYDPRFVVVHDKTLRGWNADPFLRAQAQQIFSRYHLVWPQKHKLTPVPGALPKLPSSLVLLERNRFGSPIKAMRDPVK